MISLKKYKKMIFIIILFSLIIFTFSIVSSILISDYKNNVEINGFKDNNTIYFDFDESSKVSFKDVISVLDEYNESNIYIEYDPIPKYLSNSTLFGKGVYYNYNMENSRPIIEGRDFTLEEVNSNEKKILVGKNLISKVVEEDEKKYFVIGEEKFEVIGILGNGNRNTGYDDTFIINLKSSGGFSDLRARWKLDVENSEEFNKILSAYEQIAINNNLNINITKEDNKKLDIIDILSNRPEFINIFMMVFGFGLINLIIVVYYWMNKNIKEIGIRKAYGGTDLRISLHIILQYEISVLISVLIAILAHLALKNTLISIFPMFNFDLYYENIVLAAILFMIIGLIVSIIPLIKAKKVQPIVIMKGNLK